MRKTEKALASAIRRENRRWNRFIRGYHTPNREIGKLYGQAQKLTDTIANRIASELQIAYKTK